MTKLTTDWLRKNHQRAYYFGLGFIQIKMNDTKRLHFYAKELPAFVDTPHNHRYDFISTILAGTFVNTIWIESPFGVPHYITKENCKPPGADLIEKPVESSQAVHLSRIFSQKYKCGDTYFMNHNTLHTVATIGECVTFLERSSYRKEFADVATPIGQEPVCPFSQQVSEDDIWQIVDRMIKEYIL